MRLSPRNLAAALLCMLLAVLLPATAYAADQISIDHLEQKDGNVQILLTLPKGATPDLGSVRVKFDGETFDATAQNAADAAAAVTRTTILAIDTSGSMKGAKFDAAKAAAHAFLTAAPAGLRVGLIGFGATVDALVAPTTDLGAVGNALDNLTLTNSTLLFDGVKQAIAMAGNSGSRTILLLSDGKDESTTPIQSALDAITGSGPDDDRVRIDAVAIQPDDAARAQLTQLTQTSGGDVLEAVTPAAIAAMFTDAAQELSDQVLVTATTTDKSHGKNGTLSVTLKVNGQTLADSAFVRIADDGSTPNASKPAVLQPASSGLQISSTLMWAGLGAAAVAFLALFLIAFGATDKKNDKVHDAIEAYTRQGSRRLAEAAKVVPQQSVTQQAVSAAQKVLESNKGIEAALGTRLEAAGIALKPAEWLLIHAGVIVACGFVGFAIAGHNPLLLIVLLALGVIGPWFFLGFKHRRRLKAFNSQLADTLQLMAGSLSAGLSLAQAADTVVREGNDPMASEFRRALIETRLGVGIEDALQGISHRMESKDFEWIVMAIRIQREVGGNLAELLNKVAETIREREYLERQVQTLSAEGRMSVWILGGLPPGFLAYLALANRTYLEPLITTKLGIALLVLMAIMEIAGVLWMKKVVKVEV